jgi:hypothetical protein
LTHPVTSADLHCENATRFFVVVDEKSLAVDSRDVSATRLSGSHTGP